VGGVSEEKNGVVFGKLFVGHGVQLVDEEGRFSAEGLSNHSISHAGFFGFENRLRRNGGLCLLLRSEEGRDVSME